MKNRTIASMFEEIADILEFQGELSFKVNAYRKAARVLSDLREDIELNWENGKLRSIPGIGVALAKKIDEYLKTGRMSKYEEVTKSVPDGFMELMSIQGLGPKTLALVHKELGVKNLEDLKKTIDSRALESLPGMGAKKIENILRGIELRSASLGRIPLGVALPLVESIVEQLKRVKGVLDITPAGSLRRMRENIGDIDILATGRKGKDIIDHFIRFDLVEEVLAAGETKGSVIVEGGIQVDLRVVKPDSFGAAMQYFTGSKDHNVRLRGLARERGLKVNEYGVFQGEKKIGGKTEEEVYAALGLPWIPPEMREDRGEVEVALSDHLPKLVEYQEVRGDLHVHSSYSDGSASLEEIAVRAREMGYEYVALCDHSESVFYAGGVSQQKLVEKIEEIEAINKRISCVTLLSGIEVDIKTDGHLDCPDELLEKLDVVVAAIHSGFKKNVTERMIKAMENPHVDSIAHPTGRLISSREGYDVNLDAVMRTAAETGTVLEINAHSERLDLDDVSCRKAKEMGARLAIGTDAHHLDQLWMMRLGVAVARRGWLGREDVINTYPLKKLLKYFGNTR
ncbi:MAG: DNA polymerase/3'-5' exonuclease PolX [Gemmatimonadota bacterium]|nr:MAG: DNA polymerase/3'-5' exonuclease PolX [Gemmatimonadota bacterium]